MNSQILQVVLQQLLVQAPLLLAYLVGMILAVVFLRRYPGPSILTLIAAGLSIAVIVSQMVAVQYFIQARLDSGWDMQRVNAMVSSVTVVGSFLRAVGVGLFVAAVFIRRRTA